MMKNDNDKYKLIFVWFGAFFFMVLMMIFSFRSKAASDQDFFPMFQNHNGLIGESYITVIESTLDSENNYIFIKFIDGSSSQIRVNYIVQSKTVGEPQIYGEKYNNLTNFSLYRIGNGAYSVGMLTIRSDGTYSNTALNNGFASFTNLPSSNYSNLVDYVSNFQVYTNNMESRQIVLLYQDGEIIPDGETAPDDMEKPDSADYYPDWTNAPTFDDSTVENALQSIFNYFVWFGGNIKGTIEGLGNFISDTVRWSIQKVLDRITSTAQDLLSGIQSKINDVITQIGNKIDSFTSKLEDLYDGFTDFSDLFIHPFDEEEYEEQIGNCQLISQYEELMDNCEDIRAIFNNAEERDYFVIYIDFENPFADSEHKIIHSEISFTWLKDYRTTYRPFLWVFTMIECFVGGMRLLGGIIGGKAK